MNEDESLGRAVLVLLELDTDHLTLKIRSGPLGLLECVMTPVSPFAPCSPR